MLLLVHLWSLGEDECVDQQLYQSAIGSLLYLSVSTRPDITYAVSILTRFSSSPTQQHSTALKRVMHYLKGTTNYGIMYSKKRLTRMYLLL